MVRALRTLVARIRLLITSCPAEIVDMIKIVGLCNDNLKAAQRVYAARFPDRRHPTRKTMKLLFRRAQQDLIIQLRFTVVDEYPDAIDCSTAQMLAMKLQVV
ncbi:hypothetical protein DMN91_004619 [Ooceraea biroi]|uniref:DUF4817 domain-containing protein n=1 Tax=Ooceraea biroi TaxID=2015173 RepID=A0A3L8DPQ1_OOCBI|nr:hypothetical protein DMN91_004619 [Ooceraea biroi]